jgi:hypothetical protein
MPGKRWTKGEKAELKRQAKAGLSSYDMQISGKSRAGILYKFYSLGLRFRMWSEKEVAILKKGVREGKKPWEIKVQGRSKCAIRNKMIRLKLWKPKRHCQQDWERYEVRFLRHLSEECGYTPTQIVAGKYFGKRSLHSIAQQAKRQNIKTKKRMK